MADRGHPRLRLSRRLEPLDVPDQLSEQRIKAEYERRARTIPLRRLGQENDVADAVAFLLSPAAAFINREILHVDGRIAAAG